MLDLDAEQVGHRRGNIARARGMSQLARGTGLAPADTAHQRTERLAGSPHPSPLPGGEGARNGDAAIIPAGLAGDVRTVAEKIAIAAKRLSDLRESWLNPPEWTQHVPEVIPLGMETSPYPDRILPKHGQKKMNSPSAR